MKKLPPISDFVDMSAFDFKEVDEDLLPSHYGSVHEDEDENEIIKLDMETD